MDVVHFQHPVVITSYTMNDCSVKRLNEVRNASKSDLTSLSMVIGHQNAELIIRDFSLKKQLVHEERTSIVGVEAVSEGVICGQSGKS